MKPKDRGLYIDLLAISWIGEEPGTLTLPVAGFNPRTVRSFLLRWPSTFVRTEAESDANGVRTRVERKLKRNRKEFEQGLKFTNLKLREQWLSMRFLSEIRRKAAESRYSANAHAKAPANGGSAFASASAPAKNKATPPTPPTPRDGAGGEEFFEWAHETIAVRMGRRKRIPNLDAYHGGMAGEVVAFLNRRGFAARIVTLQ